MTAIGNALVVLSAIEAVLFVALYQALAPWWRTETGRNVMALMFVIALALSLAVLRLAAPDALAHQTWIRPTVWALIAGVIGWRIVLLLKSQATAGRDRAAAADQLARRFHATCERLGPTYGYRTPDAPPVPWDDMSEPYRALMTEACAELLDHPHP